MKKTLLFITCFVAFASQFVFAQQPPLPPVEFEKKVQAIQPQLLDVRTAGEYQQSHMANALQADWNNPQQFADRIQYLDKSKPVFVYCAAGGRSAQAAKYLRDKGFKVEDLQGGFASWKMEGKAVVTGIHKAQLTMGSYKDFIASSPVTLVDIGAEWCPPCVKMEPTLNSLQKDASLHFKLLKVDGGNDIDVMKEMKVEAIPTFIIYKKGKEVWRKQGVVSAEELKEKLLQ